MIPNQNVKVKWVGYVKKYYISLGYPFTKILDEFEVDIKDLPLKSNMYVFFICDYCNGEKQVKEEEKYAKYCNLINHRKNIAKDCCRNCMGEKLKEVKANETIPIEETLISKTPDIALEWDYDKNEKTPFDYRYTHNYTDIWWKCDKGHEWQDTIYNRSYRNFKCPYCRGRYVNEGNCLATVFPQLLDEWHPTLNGEFSPKDVAPNSSKKAWWICSEGHEWETQVRHRAVIETQCPHCSESKGEKEVRKSLESNMIEFSIQYIFDDLRGINDGYLRFDFGVIDKEGNLLFLIEYDGEFHFFKIYEGDGHEITIIHDKLKDLYCIENNIALIRIPYWDFDKVGDIVTNAIRFFGLADIAHTIESIDISKYLVNNTSWTREKYKKIIVDNCIINKL